MNHPTFFSSSIDSSTPYPPVPKDHIQAVSFLSSGHSATEHLTHLLGITLEPQQYEKLSRHFLEVESRNPTYGELRLIGHMLQISHPTAFASQAAVGELYTDSEELMDTWASIMQGLSELQSKHTPLCPLQHILSLPAAYLSRFGNISERADIYRVASREASAASFAEGYVSCAELSVRENPSWQVCRKQIPPLRPLTTPRPDDAILMIPTADLDALSVFLSEHPLGTSVKAVAASPDGNVFKEAVSLCGGYGLTISLDTLLPSGTEVSSPLEAFDRQCREKASPSSPLVLLLASAKAKAHLFNALSEYEFSPCLLGTVEKKPYLSVMYQGNHPVHLHVSFADALSPHAYTCVLSPPQALCAELVSNMEISRISPSKDVGLSFVGGNLHIENSNADGYAPAIQLVLALCMRFAAVGVDTRDLKITPMLTLEGDAHAPLLVSAVCGLYRAAMELEIPLTDPVIRCVSTVPTDSTTLTLSCVAYTETPLPNAPTCLQKEGTPLFLSSLQQPEWQDIRGLLYTAAQEVRDQHTCIFPVLGEPLPQALSKAVLPSQPFYAALFESYQDLLTQTAYFGFLTEGASACHGLHVGVTMASPENISPAPIVSVSTHSPRLTMKSKTSLQEHKAQITKRRKELTAMEKIKAFEPLCKTPRTVLLDTDIGPDCDDVGALAVLIYYAKQYGFPIGGVCNCTSNKAGNGVIDAICRRCGIETPPLGQWHGEGFMDGVEYCKYNTAVAEAHSEAYRNGTLQVDDEVTYYRKRLAAAKDGDVMVISIGMFNNLAALLESPADDISPLTGVELVKAKVYALVSMAAILPQGRECNVMCDYKASEKVFNNWPTAIYLSDFHIGVNVKTGYAHITDESTIMSDPLPMSYHLYTKAWNWEGAVKGQNASYDLTAVQFAALGECELYGLDTPGDLEFYAEVPDLPDATRFIPNPMGNKIFMTKKVPDEAIADSLQKILNSF